MYKKLRFFLALTALALLLTGMNKNTAQASSAQNSYGFLIGQSSAAVPLCSFGPSACPDVAMAPDGQFIEISGSGSLNAQSGSVTGNGVYTHHFLGGFTVNGVWTAVKLLDFDETGCEVNNVLGPVCGGEAAIKVHIVADGGLFDGYGILWVDSLVGDKSKSAGGVRLNVPGVITFNKPVSGLAVFNPLP